jgi:hypothetical protein
MAPMVGPLKEVAKDARRTMKRTESRESVCGQLGMSFRHQFPANAAASDSSYTYAQARLDYRAYHKRMKSDSEEATG